MSDDVFDLDMINELVRQVKMLKPMIRPNKDGEYLLCWLTVEEYALIRGLTVEEAMAEIGLWVD